MRGVSGHRGGHGKGARRARRVLAAAALFAALAAAPAAAQQRQFALGGTMSGNYLAGRAAILDNDLDDAAIYFGQALLRNPNDPVLIERSFMLSLATGDLEAAYDLVTPMLSVFSGDPLARTTFGVERMMVGDFVGATGQFAQIEGGRLGSVMAEILSAWADFARGDVDGALARLEPLGGDQFDRFRAYNGGLIADAAGRSADAAERLAPVYEAAENNLRIAEAYLRALVRAGDRATAMMVLDAASRDNPGSPFLAAAAAAIADPAPTALAPDALAGAAEFLYGIAPLINPDNGADFAAGLYQLAAALAPQNERILIGLATLRADIGDDAAAAEILVAIPAQSPFFRAAQLQIGVYYRDAGLLEQARAALSPLVAANPGDGDAATALASLLAREDRCAQAVEVLSHALATTAGNRPESDWRLLYQRGACLDQLGRFDEAEPDLREALALSPDQPAVLNQLGYTLVDRDIDPEEGLDLIQRAVTLNPNSGAIIDSLGWAYFKLGRYDEAVTELELAVALMPANPTINDHLGDAYWMTGRRLEARFQWAHARDLDPTPAELAAILAKLASGLPEAASTAEASVAAAQGTI